jgi:hypothetical protein
LDQAETALTPVLRETCLDAWRSAVREEASIVAVVIREKLIGVQQCR